MISGVGVRNVVENKVDLTKSRNLIIIAVILVAALGVGSVDFTIGEFNISLTALAVAAIAGILLNAILPGNDYVFNPNPVTAEEDAKEAVTEDANASAEKE